jgi:hypothetical protein
MPSRGKGQSIEQMLDALSRLGVRLAPKRKIDDLTSEWAREQIERDGYEMMLVALGGDLIHPETFDTIGFLSEDVWHFDSECIEDTGDYVRIVERAMLLAGGALQMTAITDTIEIEDGLASVEWRVGGRLQRFDLKVDADWADPKIFTLLDNELVAANAAARFHAASLGQDAIIICCTESRRQALSELTGLDFASLS